MEDLRLYINSLRHDFSKQSLNEDDVNKNPFLQFEKWFTEAINAKVNEPNAMTVCTATKDAKPSARIVLLRNFDESGFVFYTNYDSRKGHEIEANPYCSVVFFWPELERQVRIEGVLKKQNKEESDLYFQTRPRTSKLGAWSSPQSKVIESRKILDEAYQKTSEKFPDEQVPRPEFWGGYVLNPDTIEFWQGRPSRLHDRIVFKKENNNWNIVRLAP